MISEMNMHQLLCKIDNINQLFKDANVRYSSLIELCFLMVIKDFPSQDSPCEHIASKKGILWILLNQRRLLLIRLNMNQQLLKTYLILRQKLRNLGKNAKSSLLLLSYLIEEDYHFQIALESLKQLYQRSILELIQVHEQSQTCYQILIKHRNVIANNYKYQQIHQKFGQCC
ncbi:unnamed protein product (macronuclear) [Paramecium tetraurelia]|uniref:Uncharacterized protein n=1 Tax=Paramecium tetraurelia TaxID=5888 RepID=A0EIR9_PARTE|nr:uncharacterized protein GSPATT00027539001 [Paramecium tetraurelia]CAK95210.1 unnamed protein product [Paramecium tetraurelia]|eukprot:XP_001462583.1 hypothetical protein (macronuclear) [Paramecium tetraurelia strain d4-2]